MHSERLAQLLRGMFLTQALLPIACKQALRMSFLLSNTVARGRGEEESLQWSLYYLRLSFPRPTPSYSKA